MQLKSTQRVKMSSQEVTIDRFNLELGLGCGRTNLRFGARTGDATGIGFVGYAK
jgi:hypothetical protein